MDSEPGPVPEDNTILGKRKRSPRNDSTSGDNIATQPAVGSAQDVLPVAPDLDSKKLRLHPLASFGPEHEPRSPVCSFNDLPVEIVQHIFTFLDPFSLGRLLCVQKSFQALIDPRRPLPAASGSCGRLPLLAQESLWSLARHLFLPHSPPPLETLSEYEMIKLIRGRRCQFCGRLPRPRSSVTPLSPWNMGPGPDGVRIVWTFKVRSCADCLGSHLLKEHDLKLSTASNMQPGMAPGFFTPSLHYIASVTLRHCSVPPQLHLTKYYFKPQADALLFQADQIRSAAPAAFSQWYRGLVPSLDAFLLDVARLEQWEASIRETNLQETAVLDASSVSSYSAYSGPQASSVAPSFLTSTSHSTWQHARNVSATRAIGNPTIGHPIPQSYPASVPGSLSHQRRLHVTNTSKSFERTSQDALRIKNERRAEIERRSQLLDPPIPLSELEKMKAFKAAILIARVLDDGEWDRLRTRLHAERAELSIPAHMDQGSISSNFPTRETVVAEATAGEDGEPSGLHSLIDRAHRSTRDKLSEIGSAFVKRCWIGGANITEESAPQFAVDVLEHVSQRFFDLQEQEDAALSLQGHPPPGDSESGMRTRALQLRHMRHVFDNCVRPYTEHVMKDLFLCSGCEIPEKRFAFNALIQHYAAKHTSDFTQGIHVVYWRSEWPRVPPYRLSPGRINPDVTGLTGHLSGAAAVEDYIPGKLTSDDQQSGTDIVDHQRAVVDWSSNITPSSQPTTTNPALGIHNPAIPVAAKLDTPEGSVLRDSRAAESISTLYEVIDHPSYQVNQPRPLHSPEAARDDMIGEPYRRYSSLDPYPVPGFRRHMRDYPHLESPAGHPRYHSRNQTESHPNLQRAYTPPRVLISEQHEIHGAQSQGAMRQFPDVEMSAAPLQSHQRAADDFLDSLAPFAAEGSPEKLGVATSRSMSYGAANLTAVNMDRRSNISQPRKPSYDISQNLRRHSIGIRDEIMDVDPPPTAPMPPTYESNLRPLHQQNTPTHHAAHMYDDRERAHFYTRPLVAENALYERYTDHYGQRSHHPVHEQSHTYSSHGSPTFRYRRTRSPERRDPRSQYQDATFAPSVPTVTERFWDRETQSYVWLKREVEPVHDPRYASGAYNRATAYDHRHSRTGPEGVSPSSERTYQTFGPASLHGSRLPPPSSSTYHHPDDAQRGRGR